MSEFRGKHAERLREIANTDEYKTAERDAAIEAARAEEREKAAAFFARSPNLQWTGKQVADAIRSMGGE